MRRSCKMSVENTIKNNLACRRYATTQVVYLRHTIFATCFLPTCNPDGVIALTKR